ncbi:uncharacterized protein LOC129290578 [Prosopis cineraria]|uniref:uncharacterized protein LOC129290578 n=1 Tax=Prosopis cineraria TaxID=364024 RepID=UPI0024104CC9|nr:uncharacterized protein LOC129290578 [Prosopis cineraria]
MGNRISFGPSDGKGKIVHWDGSVEEFEKPVMVAELMLEHPQQVVVEFHSALNHNRPVPLAADKKLERNNVYLMLPLRRGKPVRLNSEESRRILLMLQSALHSKSLLFSSRFLSRLARVCRERPVGEKVLQKNQEKENIRERYVCSELLPEITESTPEYLSRQFSGKEWKPSLDTIDEKKIQGKITGCLFP